MVAAMTQGYPVLIIGAGRGGTALLEMFLEDSLVKVVGMADRDAAAPGLELARNHGIPVFTDAVEAMRACKAYPDCIVYNLSHDDSVAEAAFRVFGDRRMASGHEVQLFWQMVTNLKQVKGELEKSQQQLQSIISNVMDGIITINESGIIQGFNPAAEQIFGYTWQEASGKSMGILMPAAERDAHDHHLARYLETGIAKVLGIRGLEVNAMRKNGEIFPMEISVSEMVLGGQRYFIGIVRDITERKSAERKIAHLAHYDYLTDLPNRALLVDVLAHSLALAERNGRKVAVLFLDLDGFKQVNDTFGHETGDLLLQGVSRRLKQILRDADTVSRVGGDEFILLLDDVGSEQNAALVAGKIIAALQPPFNLNGQDCHVGGSIGIALFPDDGDDSQKLLRFADEAMYLSKQAGKNTSRFYRDVLQGRSSI